MGYWQGFMSFSSSPVVYLSKSLDVDKYFLFARLEEQRRVETIGSGRRGASAR